MVFFPEFNAHDTTVVEEKQKYQNEVERGEHQGADNVEMMSRSVDFGSEKRLTEEHGKVEYQLETHADGQRKPQDGFQRKEVGIRIAFIHTHYYNAKKTKLFDMNEVESDKTEKLAFESVFGFVRTTLASLAAFSTAKAMCRAFVFAMPLKLSILLHKHLDADAYESNGYNN